MRLDTLSRRLGATGEVDNRKSRDAKVSEWPRG